VARITEAMSHMEPKSRSGDPLRPKGRRKIPRRKWNPVITAASAAGVVLVVVVLAWMAWHFSKSWRGESRLIGTWQSDADATITELRKSRPVTNKQEQAMRKLFGRMKITYTKTTLTTDFDGSLDTQPYQVVSKDRDSVVIKSWFALSKKDEQFRIRFIGSDVYWVDVEQFALSECFRRIE
jgi:hypothetical protein